jgi:hypothetical protein
MEPFWLLHINKIRELPTQPLCPWLHLKKDSFQSKLTKNILCCKVKKEKNILVSFKEQPLLKLEKNIVFDKEGKRKMSPTAV